MKLIKGRDLIKFVKIDPVVPEIQSSKISLMQMLPELTEGLIIKIFSGEASQTPLWLGGGHILPHQPPQLRAEFPDQLGGLLVRQVQDSFTSRQAGSG